MTGSQGMNTANQQQTQHARTSPSSSPRQQIEGKKPEGGQTTPTDSPRQLGGKPTDGDQEILDLVADSAGNLINDSPPRKSKRRGAGNED